MNRQHIAKYLVLLGTDAQPRALLFSDDHDYLTEIFDEDGLMLDNLIRSGAMLKQPPTGLALDTVLPAAYQAHAAMRCFDLDAAAHA